MDCVFCKIISGEYSCNKVYEDDKVLVFLDINPHTNGDCLIVPKKHILDYHEVDEELNNHITEVTKKLDEMYREKLGSKGLTIIHNSGDGQEVKHFHIHFIPRYELTDIKLTAERELKPVEEVYKLLKK